ncbi:hypothetical protein [Streptomyces sp. NPDC002746]
MPRTMPKPGTAVDITKFIEKLDAARGTLAYDADTHHYDRHHSERADLDSVFDDLIDYLRAHQTPAQLKPSAKPVTDPTLTPGDVVVLDSRFITVRRIRFHAPGGHADSGLPQNQAVMEIVSGHGSQFLALTPQA